MSIQLPIGRIFTGFVNLLDWPAEKATTLVTQNVPILQDKLSSLLAKTPQNDPTQASVDKIPYVIRQGFAKIASLSIPASTFLKVGASLLGVCEHVVAKHIWNRLGPWKEALDKNSSVQKSAILRQRLCTAVSTSSCFDEQMATTSFDTAFDTLFSQSHQTGSISFESESNEIPLSFSLKQAGTSIFSLGLHFYLFKFVLLKTFEVGFSQLPSLVSTPLEVWNEYSFGLPFTLLTASCYAYWTHQVASRTLFRQDKTASSPLEASFLVEKMFSLLTRSIKPQTSQGAIAKCKSDAIEVLTTALFVAQKPPSRKPTPLVATEGSSLVSQRRGFVPLTERAATPPSSSSQSNSTTTAPRQRPSSTSVADSQQIKTISSSDVKTTTPKTRTPRGGTPSAPETTSRGGIDVARAGEALTKLLQRATGENLQRKTDEDEFHEIPLTE